MGVRVRVYLWYLYGFLPLLYCPICSPLNGKQVPELAALGRVFRSTAPVELTESETEYVVRCVKHVLDRHVVLDFAVSNTIEEQVRFISKISFSVQFSCAR